MTCDVCEWDTFFTKYVEHDMRKDVAMQRLSTPSRECLLTYLVMKAHSMGMRVRFVQQSSMQYVVVAFGKDGANNRYVGIRARESDGRCLVKVSPHMDDILRNMPTSECICCASCNKQMLK